jgi:hypothetical protein
MIIFLIKKTNSRPGMEEARRYIQWRLLILFGKEIPHGRG